MGWKKTILPSSRSSEERETSAEPKRPATQKGTKTMKVGLLCGREYSFPPAFLQKVNELGKRDDISAEFVHLGGVRMGEPAEYRVIVDRISHEVEFYRGRQIFQLCCCVQAGHRHSENDPVATEILSFRRGYQF
jgi:hypothetical protein